MASAPVTNEYLLLMRGTKWDKGLSPQTVQDGLEAMGAWIDALKAKGMLTSGQPLSEGGSVISSSNDMVSDGPFIESKEAVGGYIMLSAKTLDEAIQAAKECPVLRYGLSIEVRPMASDCHMIEEYGLDMSMTSR